MNIINEEQLKQILENIEVKNNKKVLDAFDNMLYYAFIFIFTICILITLILFTPVVLTFLIIYFIKNNSIKLWRKIWKE